MFDNIEIALHRAGFTVEHTDAGKVIRPSERVAAATPTRAGHAMIDPRAACAEHPAAPAPRDVRRGANGRPR